MEFVCSDVQHDSNIIVASFHTSLASAWSIESGVQIQTYKGHTSAGIVLAAGMDFVFGDLLFLLVLISVDFDYSAGLVPTGSADLTVKLWNLYEGLCLRTLVRAHALGS